MLGTIAGDRGKVAADRARSAISAMFAWAIGEGLVDANPTIGVTKHAGVTSRDRVLKDEELAAIWLALDDDDYGRIVKLLILTGQRKTRSPTFVVARSSVTPSSCPASEPKTTDRTSFRFPTPPTDSSKIGSSAVIAT